jgi:hypothetical protein
MILFHSRTWAMQLAPEVVYGGVVDHCDMLERICRSGSVVHTLCKVRKRKEWRNEGEVGQNDSQKACKLHSEVVAKREWLMIERQLDWCHDKR